MGSGNSQFTASRRESTGPRGRSAFKEVALARLFSAAPDIILHNANPKV